jgi:hypothetical protein
VIEDEAEDTPEHEMTLVESARAERERRNTTPKTEIVITDKNLSDYSGAKLTISEGPARVLTKQWCRRRRAGARRGLLAR